MYSIKPEGEHAKLLSHNVPISLKKAKIVCRKIRKRTLKEAEEFLVSLLEGRTSIGGKYYTKASSELLKLLR